MSYVLHVVCPNKKLLDRVEYTCVVLCCVTSRRDAYTACYVQWHCGPFEVRGRVEQNYFWLLSVCPSRAASRPFVRDYPMCAHINPLPYTCIQTHLHICIHTACACSKKSRICSVTHKKEYRYQVYRRANPPPKTDTQIRIDMRD